MATIADLRSQIAAIKADVDTLKAQPAPVATQADLDQISSDLSAVAAEVASLKPVPPTS